MSAYLVNDSTINGILAHLEVDRENKQFINRLLEFAEPVLSPRGEHTLSAVGHALFSLNCVALDQRYGAGESRTFREPFEGYHYRRVAPPTKVQALKSLRCLLYQCSEGDVPERPLYQVLVDLANVWAQDIVEALPAYNTARWG